MMHTNVNIGMQVNDQLPQNTTTRVRFCKVYLKQLKKRLEMKFCQLSFNNILFVNRLLNSSKVILFFCKNIVYTWSTKTKLFNVFFIFGVN